jgi:hypothetical protein
MPVEAWQATGCEFQAFIFQLSSWAEVDFGDNIDQAFLGRAMPNNLVQN